MISLVGFLKCPAGVSRDEFHQWWVEKHVPYVMKLPGLRRYVVHLAHKGFHVGSTSATILDAPDYDGVAELWFDDEEALMKAWASREGVEDLGHFASLGITVFNGLNEPKVMVPGP